MNNSNHYIKLNNRFIEYWSKKREKKLKYYIINTSFFSVPLSLILGYSNFGFKGMYSFKFLVMFITTFLLYFLFIYFIEFPINEKRYQKLIKEKEL
uniref:hypothetical protein n=1 Tax=uncultured Polaribacter sp. TaxID=174711 RepID=UPI00263395C1|nr:hypothetical protein [uncultured Polaribacter sp.]